MGRQHLSIVCTLVLFAAASCGQAGKGEKAPEMRVEKDVQADADASAHPETKVADSMETGPQPLDVQPADLETPDVAPDHSDPADVDPDEVGPADVAPDEVGPADVSTDEQGPADASPDEASPDICEPDCDGKECGEDGCGGLCGECPANAVCEPACAPQHDLSASLGQSGSESAKAVAVGPDGAIYVAGNFVASYGLVALFSTVCGLTTCTCVPDCTGKECGSDGCWGECGECGCQESCEDGGCVFHGCDGKECRDDGCGGICGVCAPDEVCLLDSCVSGLDTIWVDASNAGDPLEDGSEEHPFDTLAEAFEMATGGRLCTSFRAPTTAPT